MADARQFAVDLVGAHDVAVGQGRKSSFTPGR